MQGFFNIPLPAGPTDAFRFSSTGLSEFDDGGSKKKSYTLD